MRVHVVCLCVTFCIATGGFADAEESKLQLIENSSGISRVVDLNANGQIIGLREIVERGIGLRQQSFFRSGDRDVVVPLLKGFTNMEPLALSDNGMVVGYAGRPLGHPQGSLRAFLWDVRGDASVGLGTLPDDRSSHAFDISADGHLVTGYSVGRDPARMVPCVWEQVDGVWCCTALSTIHPYNPFLLTSGVVVSDDGDKIAACITVKIISGPVTRYPSSLVVWERQPDNQLQRRRVLDRAVRLGDINNQGMIAGSCLVKSKDRAFVYVPQEGFQLLELLEGDVSGAALDVNNHGTVVGYSDDPAGPLGGPQPFTWSDGQLSRLNLPDELVFGSADAINDAGQVAGYVQSTHQEEGPGQTLSFILQMGSREHAEEN